MGKIDSTTLLIVDIINRFHARQQVRKYTPMAQNLESYQKLYDSVEWFCPTMEKYFTFHRIMIRLR